MSELVGGKCGRTLRWIRCAVWLGVSCWMLELGVPCGSACSWLESVCRWICAGSAVPCGSASPVGDRISDISAARRFLFVIRSRISVRLGVSHLFSDLGYQCGSASPVCDRISDISAARLQLDSNRIRIGFRLDFEWILNGFLHEFQCNWIRMDSEWILMGFCMDSEWIPNGF